MCIFRNFRLFNVFYQWLAESAPAGPIDAEGKMRNAECLKHLNSIWGPWFKRRLDNRAGAWLYDVVMFTFLKELHPFPQIQSYH